MKACKVVLAGVIVSALLGGVSPRARADYFGSLAYDFSSGAYGEAHDYSSPESARAHARAACQQYNAGYCKIVKTFDSCGALSVGANLESYYGVGQNKELAAQRAMRACRTNDRGPCTPLVSVCNKWDVGGSGSGAAPGYQPPHSKMCRNWVESQHQYVTTYCYSSIFNQ
jgi:hypothetical protein